MVTRFFLCTIVALAAIVSSGVEVIQAQAAWDGERYVEILLVTESGESLPVEGACFVIWSREGPTTPLQVCDNVPGDLVSPLNLGSGEGGAVAAMGISDLETTAGVIWVDVGSIGPKVLIAEAVPPVGFGVAIGCDTGFALCGQDGSDTQIGTTTVFVYDAESIGDGSLGQVPSSASLACDIVELYPGYPGYRGVVTGLVGKGDTACLADLQVADPTFSRAAQDAANRQVAQTLGIGGDPPNWTWEIWMAIGAERGYGHICYSCMWLGYRNVVPTGPGSVDPTDPRLVLSGVTTHLFALDYARRHGTSVEQLYVPITDGQLRVFASAIQAGHYPTAPDLIEAADYVVEVYSCVSADRCGYIGSNLICTMANQGGHTPVPKTASPDDQVGILTFDVLASAQASTGAWGTDSTEAVLTSAWDQWTAHQALTANPEDAYFASYVWQAFGC